ncbi:MAG: threonine-phosphate decarboxylase CobD [Thermodesulfobacteriota bacterium]|nr:MAG: threonine-phosphate decarboxylase CobD [Thermodesulfobacteriota bacterium]
MVKDIHGGNIWQAAKEASRPLEKIIDFSASINPLGPPTSAIKAIEEGLRLIPPYPDPSANALKEALAARHGVSTDNILPANGSTELIYLIPRLIKPGRALIIEPAFSEYKKALALAGWKAESFVMDKEDGFRLDLGKLGRRLSKGFSLVFMANPANPTGVLYSEEETLSFLKLSRTSGALAVLDEAFIDFSGGSVMREAIRAGNAIVLRSMTKFYALAGLRLGYAAAERKLLSRLERLKPPWSVNTLSSIAGAACLADARYSDLTAEWLSTERDALSKGIASVKGLEPLPSSANYLMVRISKPRLDARALASRLFQQGILIRDLSAFRGLGPEFFRVAVLGRDANRFLINSLKQAMGEAGARKKGARKRGERTA